MRIEDFSDSGLLDDAHVQRTVESAWDLLEKGLLDALRIHMGARPRITPTEWAVNTPRIIPADGHQPHPGPYTIANSPIMRAVQDSVVDKRTRTVVMRIAAQVGKSAAATNIIGHRIMHDPCGITLIYPDDETAEKKIKEDFTPMFEATPQLRALVYEEEKPKHGRSTLKRFTFLGGHILPVTARSPAKTASSPAGLVVCDEYSKFVNTGEGDPGMAAVVRGQRYPNFRAVFLSTPVGDAKTCKITGAYEKGDRSLPGVFCPGCKKWHTLEFEQKATNTEGVLTGVHIPKQDGEYSYDDAYHQHECGYKLFDAKRFELLDSATWRSTRPFRCCGRLHDPFNLKVAATGERVETWEVGGTGEGIPHCPDCGKSSSHARTRSFTASTLFAKVALGEVARNFHDAKDDPASLMQFNNQFLAKSFRLGGEAPKKDLASRRIDYWNIWGDGVDVPPDVMFLIMVCDVQHDRVECEIIGLAPNFITYGIAFRRIYGSTLLAATWDQVEAFRQQTWEGVDPETGETRIYRPILSAIDVGDSTTLAHAYAERHMHNGVYPIRGAPERMKDLITPNKKGKIFWWISKKHTLASWERRLAVRPNEQGVEQPGQVYYPADIETLDGRVVKSTGYDDKYFQQAVNFHRITKRNPRTFQKYETYEAVDKTIAEEAVDIRAYSIGMEKIALMHYRVGRLEDIPRGWRLASELVADPVLQPEVQEPTPAIDPEDVPRENPALRGPRRRAPVPKPDPTSPIARTPRPGLSSPGRTRPPGILGGGRNPRARGE